MARIRTVKPDLWQDEAIGEISIEARLTFLGLITQADDFGRLKGAPKLVRAWVFPYDDYSVEEIAGWLRELSGEGLIHWFKVGGKEFIELPSWSKHQRVSHPTESALPSHEEADSTDAPESLPKTPEEPRREGKGREGSKEGKGKEPAAFAPDVNPLCFLLAQLMKENGVRDPKIGKTWLDAERLLISKDKRPPDEAERLLRWSQKHSFWHTVILSMPTFRERYDQMLLQAKAGKSKGQSAGVDQAHRFAAKAKEEEAKERAAA